MGLRYFTIFFYSNLLALLFTNIPQRYSKTSPEQRCHSHRGIVNHPHHQRCNTSHKAVTDSDNTWGSFQLTAFDQYSGMIGNDKYKLSLDKEENDTITTGNISLTLRVYNTESYYEELQADTADTFEYGAWSPTGYIDLVVDDVANYNYTWRNGAVKTVTVDANYLDPTFNLFITSVDNYVAKDDPTTGEAGTLHYKVSAPKDAKNWSYTATGSAIVLSFNKTDVKDTEGDLINGGFAYGRFLKENLGE